MQFSDILNIFQGITTLFDSPSHIMIGRIGLILIGGVLVYLGKKGTLEPLLMIPMGLGMVAVNAGVLFMPSQMAETVTRGSLESNVAEYISITTNVEAAYTEDGKVIVTGPEAAAAAHNLAFLSRPDKKSAANGVDVTYSINGKLFTTGKSAGTAIESSPIGANRQGLEPSAPIGQQPRERVELAFTGANGGEAFKQLETMQAGRVQYLADMDKAQSGEMPGNLMIAPLVQQPKELMDMQQITALQPIYTFAFGNSLIACLVFMGIGVLLDVGFLLARPFLSMFIALACEFGTIITFPIAKALGFSFGEAASIALVGCADGPMVLFASLNLAKHMFVPITVVAYLYLGLAYGGYPYLIRLLVPAKLRGIKLPQRPVVKITAGEKLAFAVAGCGVLCLLFPSAAPLFLSLFLGVAVREAGLKVFTVMIENVFLYGATMFLGLLLGVLCEASTILNPKVVMLLVLGILALLLSGVGGICGGYILYIVSGRKINPVIGISGVSCVPTTAKVAQKEVSKVNPNSIILPEALGANISGVITSAIITGIYVTLIPILEKL
ncbi:sodium ion-translocating decarboxylase beta subunit [Ereboglobus sp. PH5-10]|uniref:sodium ion-translocating decarboxylase subunit beta n=1 Tax=Ereboglobus sp. PH5-10 TaxID=2940629 RepID=UPI0024053A94|nr:sodium ion-translocating decarboxylase subunit beta [Ereboglobus sp. PH5-10]MDF9827141.1 sodium ion-translocating decarboxylase beta subunit [Ereboglobus sp. PH5-10]